MRRAEAGAWLRRGSRDYDVVVEDLSVVKKGDVVKPEETWANLPGLVKRRLRPGGIAIFNLLRPEGMTWREGVTRVARPFGGGHLVCFRDFENRLLTGGAAGWPARRLSVQLRNLLRSVGSKLADRVEVRSFPR